MTKHVSSLDRLTFRSPFLDVELPVYCLTLYILLFCLIKAGQPINIMLAFSLDLAPTRLSLNAILCCIAKTVFETFPYENFKPTNPAFREESESERERERERNNANLFILAGFVACDEHCLNLLISSMNFGMVLKFMFLANSQTGVLKPNV
jgi:hypothetical protein